MTRESFWEEAHPGCRVITPAELLELGDTVTECLAALAETLGDGELVAIVPAIAIDDTNIVEALERSGAHAVIFGVTGRLAE